MRKNVPDADALFGEIEQQHEADLMLHNKVKDRIDSLLCEKKKDSNQEIGKTIRNESFARAFEYFNDLRDFMSSYLIYETECGSGADFTIYDVTESVDDYLYIRHILLYCFRRIQLLQDKTDIESVFMELFPINISAIFVLAMLKELEVGDRGFVGRVMSKLYFEHGRDGMAKLLGSLVSSVYPDGESHVHTKSVAIPDKSPDLKVSFISCVNDQRVYEECLFYISKLIIPQGVSIDTVCITEADSMASGYNAGMEASEADIKIYLHQDVCIINPFFLVDLIDIFESDKSISMIGMIGSPKLPEDAVMWHDHRVGKLYHDDRRIEFEIDSKSRYSGIEYVQAVDGLLIATNKDVKWRDDIFDGWDFYDVSAGAEHRKLGYRIAVPVVESPWVIHDDGLLNLYSYDKYRKVFIGEYGTYYGKGSDK